jgi:hypothetical protein
MAAPAAVAAPHLGRLGVPARATVAFGSLAVLLGSGAAIAVGAAAGPSGVVPASRHGLPGWIAGPLAGLGASPLTSQQFLLLVGAMSAAYLGVIVFGTALRARWILGTVAALHIAFLLAPPLLSTDAFNYIDYARLGALHGLDPYAFAPIAAPHDPAFAVARWHHALSAYGPLFTLGSYPLAFLGVPAALWTLKAVIAAASLGCVALVWSIARRLGHEPVRAAAIFGLNPLVLVWTVGGAHNDVLMLLLMLAGVALVLSSWEALGGAAVLAAAAVKASAGLAIPFVVLGARRRWRALAGVAAAAAVIGAAAVVAFPGHALGVIDALRQDQHLVVFDSVPVELSRLFGSGGATGEVRSATTVALVAVLAWLAWRVWRGHDWVSACGWALVALVVSSTWFLAWYTVWPLAFAAVTRDRRLLTVTLAIEAYFVVNHWPGFTVVPR